jgi:hypothetical protein
MAPWENLESLFSTNWINCCVWEECVIEICFFPRQGIWVGFEAKLNTV